MTDDTEDLSSAPALDRITAALALCDLADMFYDLAVNGKAYKARLRKQAKLEKENAALEQNIAAATTQAAAIVAKAKAEVLAIHDEAQARLEAAETAEQEIQTRERKISILENAWRGLGEGPDVWSGLRSPEFSPLQKARMAAGREPGKDPDIHGFSQYAEPTAALDALIRRDVGDERSDSQGNSFAPSSLTRSTEHKRGAA
jgi:hypothetical protein